MHKGCVGNSIEKGDREAIYIFFRKGFEIVLETAPCTDSRIEHYIFNKRKITNIKLMMQNILHLSILLKSLMIMRNNYWGNWIPMDSRKTLTLSNLDKSHSSTWK